MDVIKTLWKLREIDNYLSKKNKPSLDCNFNKESINYKCLVSILLAIDCKFQSQITWRSANLICNKRKCIDRLTVDNFNIDINPFLFKTWHFIIKSVHVLRLNGIQDHKIQISIVSAAKIQTWLYFASLSWSAVLIGWNKNIQT